MSWKDYYNGPWGDRYGATAGRPNPHRGTDLSKPGGSRVPSYVDGTVAAVVKNSVVGWHVTISIGGGRYISYCHMRVGTMPKVGSKVKRGDMIGTVAGWGDFTGSAWTGPHIHITETSSTHPAMGPWFDPQPRITKATIIDRIEEKMDRRGFVYGRYTGTSRQYILGHVEFDGGYRAFNSYAELRAMLRLYAPNGLGDENNSDFWDWSLGGPQAKEHEEIKAFLKANHESWKRARIATNPVIPAPQIINTGGGGDGGAASSFNITLTGKADPVT